MSFFETGHNILGWRCICTFGSRVYQMTIYTERRVAHRHQTLWEIPTKEGLGEGVKRAQINLFTQ